MGRYESRHRTYLPVRDYKDLPKAPGEKILKRDAES
jgi:hypothetical protein